MKKFLLYAAIAAVLATPFAYAGFTQAATSYEVVTENTSNGENQPGWMFNRDLSTSTPYVFTEDEASAGNGSLYVQPISGDNASNKFIAENFINEPVADVGTISYDFMIGEGGDSSDAEQFYMNVYANFGESDDFKFYDCRYNIVPTTGSTDSWTTVTFDPTLAYDVTTRGGANASPYTCPAIPADMDDLSPNSTIRAIAISVGDTSASDAGLDGYLDNVIVNIGDDETTYDFELTEQDENAPTVPVHLSPANMAVLDPEDLTSFDWQDSTDEEDSEITYHFQLSTGFDTDEDGAFVTTIYDQAGLTASEFALPADLAEGDYYWHVMAIDESGNESAWSDAWTFEIDEDGEEEPVAPTTKDECKNGGWMTFSDPSFKNQGQCVSYVATRQNQQ